jgi:aminoglycoside phosphotransferase family enzyme
MPSTLIGPHSAGSGIEEKVRHLQRAEAYPDRPDHVDTVETHMSWVFLTDRYVYKLKKPVRYNFLDFGIIDARHRNCEEEVRLNRRLAPDVYLGTIPLAVVADGILQLGGTGAVVDWLVKMRRLPADRMLDQCIRHGRVPENGIAALGTVLARFYATRTAIEVTADEYRQRFEDEIRSNLRALATPGTGVSVATVTAVCSAQLRLLAEQPELFRARVEAGRIIEGHGDLRPEHVCFEATPVIIDCLEFRRELRILDALDDLALLSMECRRLGTDAIGSQVLDIYARVTGDRAPQRLLAFYHSFRATVRARLAVWHVQEPGAAGPEEWSRRARHYLALAADYAQALP